jgi:hypothetical protein
MAARLGVGADGERALVADPPAQAASRSAAAVVRVDSLEAAARPVVSRTRARLWHHGGRRSGPRSSAPLEGTMSVTGLAQDDITRMRDQLFFDGPNATAA